MATMRLTVLGSGTCELKAERSSPAYLVEAGGTSVLLDLGQGALRRLMETGVDPVDVDAVLLSHHHLDHFADVLPLLFALNYDPTMSAEARVTIVGDRSLEEVFAGLGEAFGEWVQPSPQVLTRRLVVPGDVLSLGELDVRCERAAHMGSSLAYRLERQGVGLVYLGDSTATEDLVTFAAGADLLVCHTVGSADDRTPNHISPSDAGVLARDAGVGALLLSHLYRSQDLEKSVAEAGRAFDGRVIVAEDLMVLDVG